MPDAIGSSSAKARSKAGFGGEDGGDADTIPVAVDESQLSFILALRESNRRPDKRTNKQCRCDAGQRPHDDLPSFHDYCLLEL